MAVSDKTVTKQDMQLQARQEGSLHGPSHPYVLASREQTMKHQKVLSMLPEGQCN